MCSPTTFQMASSTHCPSWSQAPSVWGSPKSPSDDRAVDGAHDLGQRDLRRGTGEDVAAADAALGAHEPGSFEREEDLLQVGLGESGALRDVSDRGRARLVRVQGKRKQGPAGVVTACGHPHDLTVGPRVCFAMAPVMIVSAVVPLSPKDPRG